MNLSRNKLSKIANTKYQSRKNRPSKKKNAGASKIRTKFTKKRKIGGKGKNLRKNTMKQKIQFNKKGGADGEENPAAAAAGKEQTDDILVKELENLNEQRKKAHIDFKDKNEKNSGGEEAKKAFGIFIKLNSEIELTKAKIDLQQAQEELQQIPTDAADSVIEDAKKKVEVVTRRVEAAEKNVKQIKEEVEKTAAAPGPEVKSEVTKESESAASAPAPGTVVTAPEQESTAQKSDNRFKVILDMGVDDKGDIKLLGAESTITGKIDTSGVSTIVTLDQGNQKFDSDIKNKPIDDMLKQIVEMLNDMKKQ